MSLTERDVDRIEASLAPRFGQLEQTLGDAIVQLSRHLPGSFPNRESHVTRRVRKVLGRAETAGMSGSDRLQIRALVAIAEEAAEVRRVLRDIAARADIRDLHLAALEYLGGKASSGRIGKVLGEWGRDFGGKKPSRSVASTLAEIRREGWGGGVRQDEQGNWHLGREEEK